MIERLEHFFFGTWIIQEVQDLVGLGWDQLFNAGSLLGDLWGIILVIGVSVWFWGRETTYALVGIIALGAVTKEGLSKGFSLPRPQGPDIVVYEHLEVASFPSGHVYQILTPWGLLYAYRLVPLLVPILIVLVVGFSRIYLGVHYLGDIVAAIVFGILLVWAYVHLWPRVQPWLARRSTRFYIGLALVGAAGVGASILVTFNNPRRWEILGALVGAAAGLLLEPRYVGYEPGRTSAVQGAAKLVVGTAGIILFLVIDRLLPPDALVPGLFTACAASLWAVLGAPALFVRLGWQAEAARSAGGR